MNYRKIVKNKILWAFLFILLLIPPLYTRIPALYFYIKGYFHFRNSDYDRAIANLTRAAEFSPKSFAFYKTRGYAYLEKGEYDRAIEDFNRVTKVSRIPRVFFSRGIAFHQKGDLGPAIADYTTAILARPEYPQALFRRGTAFQEQGQFEAARRDFSAACRLGLEPACLESGQEKHPTP